MARLREPSPYTFFTNVAGGYELRAKSGNYLSAFIGPAAISQVDSKLGSWYQFKIDFGVGIKVDSGKALGFHYEHFSNAGIVQPNIGRDILALSVQF